MSLIVYRELLDFADDVVSRALAGDKLAQYNAYGLGRFQRLLFFFITNATAFDFKNNFPCKICFWLLSKYKLVTAT